MGYGCSSVIFAGVATDIFGWTAFQFFSFVLQFADFDQPYYDGCNDWDVCVGDFEHDASASCAKEYEMAFEVIQKVHCFLAVAFSARNFDFIRFVPVS